MPEPNPTPPPDDLPILVGPADVDQLLETAEALADEIAAAVGLAGPRAPRPETVASPAAMPATVAPSEGHTIIEAAPPPVEKEHAEKIPELAPVESIAPAEAIAAQPASPSPEVVSRSPAPADAPLPVESPIASELPPPQNIAKPMEPPPEPVAVEPPAQAAPPQSPPSASAVNTDDANQSLPKVSIVRRMLVRFMRGMRAVALAPILALAALAWLFDRPFAKTPARVKSYIGAIALATAITAALSFILPDLLKDDPFAGETTASESAPQ